MSSPISVRRTATRLTSAALAATVAVAGIAGVAPAVQAASVAPQVTLPAFSHVYVIVMENKEYSTIIGSKSAPYINSLVAKYGNATNYYAVAHPSEPNYIAMFSGSTQGVTTDGAYNLSAKNLADQLEAKGKTWHVYAQDWPGNCYTGSSYKGGTDGPGYAGTYVRKHNPAISFTDISHNATRCGKITNLASFSPTKANFELIVPNLINDMHDGTIAQGDAFLKAFVPKITSSAAFATSALVITWDEGSTNLGGGGKIPTIVVTPHMVPGTKITATLNHYSLLRTIEQAWGLGYLGKASTAYPISGCSW